MTWEELSSAIEKMTPKEGEASVHICTLNDGSVQIGQAFEIEKLIFQPNKLATPVLIVNEVDPYMWD